MSRARRGGAPIRSSRGSRRRHGGGPRARAARPRATPCAGRPRDRERKRVGRSEEAAAPLAGGARGATAPPPARRAWGRPDASSGSPRPRAERMPRRPRRASRPTAARARASTGGACRRAPGPTAPRGEARARSALAASRWRRARLRRAAPARQTGILSSWQSGPYRRTSGAVPFCDPEGGLMSEWTREQRRWLRGGLAVLAGTPAVVGILGTVSPRGFFDAVPRRGDPWGSAGGAGDQDPRRRR